MWKLFAFVFLIWSINDYDDQTDNSTTMRVVQGLSSSSSSSFDRPKLADGRDQCTTIIISPKASVDGSAMVTYTADCEDCDFRMNKVPPMSWPENSLRAIYLSKGAYPLRIAEDRGYTYSKENLDKSLPQVSFFVAFRLIKVVSSKLTFFFSFLKNILLVIFASFFKL